MSPISDRNRQLIITRIEGDPRLDGAKVHAAAPLMRMSIFATVAVAIAGAIIAQVIFGEGTVQFALGMGAGYAGYFIYLFATMGEPRVIGVMAALTDTKVILLGSRRAGIVGEYRFQELDSLSMPRKGNLLRMSKIVIKPVGSDGIKFLGSNRRQATIFVEEYQRVSGSEVG
ncbi:MAG: hypothetical protein U9N84_07775 [Actinomycetota bacterium]|nr:hypothetical protein [Actinomycetota bacterium]